MPDALWRAAAALAKELRATPKLRSFRRAFDPPMHGDDFPRRLSELTARYSPLRSHPMLLGVRLNRMPATAELIQSDADAAWLGDAVEAGTAFQVIVEFLRSRLPGYPSLRLPHLRDGSPHAFDDPFLVRGFPWDAELRRLSLQLQGPPPMTELGGGDHQNLIADLVGAVEARPTWTRFADARGALSDVDRQALTELGRQFAARVDEDALDEAAGDLVLSRYKYRLAALDEIVSGAEGAVAEYLNGFERLDELITVVAAVLETAITSEGLLEVEPYRMDLGTGEDLRPIELAVSGDVPMHNAGEVFLVQGPDEQLSGLVYPTAITHRWGRLDDHASSRMIVSGQLASGSG